MDDDAADDSFQMSLVDDDDAADAADDSLQLSHVDDDVADAADDSLQLSLVDDDVADAPDDSLQLSLVDDDDADAADAADAADVSFQLSLVDVHRLSVQDISKRGFQLDLRHLSPWERAACCKFISKLQARRSMKDRNDARLGVDAEKLAERLGRMSPRRIPFSHIETPAPSVERLTPPYFEYLEDRPRKESEAYETLIQEGGQPSHPIELPLSAAKKHREYKEIISYWKIFRGCGHSPYRTQLAYWRSFRTFQEKIRERYESQNILADYPEHVNELRRKHNLEGNAETRLEYTEHSGLDDWMEYQYHLLENCENLEEPLNMAKAALDAAKEEVYDAGDSEFGDEFQEIKDDYIEDSDYTEAEGYEAPAREPHYWNKINRKIDKAKTATKYRERAVQLLEHKSNVAEISESDQAEAASAMKRLEKAKEKVSKLKLRLNLVEAARALASIQRELKFHNILVDWTEQQKPLIAARENARPQLPKLRGQTAPQLAGSGISSPDDDWEEEELRALAAKRTVWDHMSSIIIKGKRGQFPILDVCMRRSKRIASRKEKRRAREQGRLPPHPTPAARVLLHKNLNLSTP